MSYEAEDQVDWSDGSFDNDHLSTIPDAVLAPKSLDESSLQPGPTMSTKRISSPGPNHRLSGLSATQHPEISSQRQKDTSGRKLKHAVSAQANLYANGRRLTQRQPTKDELSKFILYQANQKIYEAMFFKTFVSHALHPDRFDLKESRNDSPDVLARIKGYLRDVSSSVNQLANKMIWNAHFKTTNFLTKPGQDGLPFINTDSFKGSLFNDVDPQSGRLVVQKMNQSWHRIYKASSMVQHSARNYPAGTHYSPFEDIQEATAQNLLNSKGLSTGRIVKPPLKKRASLGAARRDSKALPHVILDRPNHPSQCSAHTGCVSDLSILRVNRDIDSGPNFEKTFASQLSLPNAFARYEPAIANSSTPMATNADLDIKVEPSLLERLVAQSDPNTTLLPLLEEHPSQLETLVAHANRDINCGRKDWRMRLINDHNRRLAKQRRVHIQPSVEQPRDLKSIVARAVDRGLLQRPTSQTQQQIDKLAMMEKSPSLSVPTVVTRPSVGKLVRSSCHAPKIPSSSKEVGKNQKRSGQPPRKRPKTRLDDDPLPPNSLPDNAYSTPNGDEKSVWRCGLNHCMGYYYNAGDRSFCVGCNTSMKKMKGVKIMDFYLSSKSWFFKDAPGHVWKPSKFVKEAKKSSCMFHNAIAKAAWYAAYNAGATEEEAHQKACEAVLEHIQPKIKLEPIPEPTPEPEPEPIDPGPHPSGSTTMEHGQGIPECYSFNITEKFQTFAWRCDGGHALGRYYMAGDKHTCPGCGLGITAKGARREIMDFYMPSGAVVRQEAPNLVEWHPRRNRAKESTPITTHNQLCTKMYHDALDEGQAPEQALAFAIKATDEHLDAKHEEIEAYHKEKQRRKAEKEQAKREQATKLKQVRAKDRVAASASASGSQTPTDGFCRNSDEGVVIRLIPQKRGREGVDSGSEDGEEGFDEEGDEVEEEPEEPTAEVVDPSSGDESSSGSDSE